MKTRNLILSTTLMGAIAAPALAQTEATTTTALNLRATPSEFSQSQMILQSGETVMIEGCLEDLTWCKVGAGEEMQAMGWVSGAYIRTEEGADPVAQLDADGNRQVDVQIVTVTTEDAGNDAEGAAAGAVIGALTAVATGGASGIVVASALGGAVAGDVVEDITDEEVTYVVNNRVETVYLDGEVVIGAAIPDGVETYEIPNSAYRYLVVNNTAVIVDAETGAIVGIVS